VPLTGRQITSLINVIDEQWDLEHLALFAQDNLDINIYNLAPEGDLKTRAFKLINELNSVYFPPRDDELLERLQTCQNARLRQVASELLQPSFYSPTRDPHDAIVLGKWAFVDRAELRHKLREFTQPTHNTTRVLIIRGDKPCGKSYSWWFLRHLAKSSVGVTPLHLELGQLSEAGWTPRQFIEEVFKLLDLDPAKLPPMTGGPQSDRIRPLISAFIGQIVGLQRRYWLVIDDINDQNIEKSIRDTVYGIAYSVEDTKPDNLWVALLGYNEMIPGTTLRLVLLDEARFPDAALLAEHFQFMAKMGPRPIRPSEAREYADLLLARFPELTKEAMTTLTPDIEKVGERLRLGERP
jgi:hypothetical protein